MTGEERKKQKKKESNRGKRVYCREASEEDEPLFLHARPVSRLMNCIIGNPEYKLDSAITSSNR